MSRKRELERKIKKRKILNKKEKRKRFYDPQISQ